MPWTWAVFLLFQGSYEREARVPVVLPLGEQGAGAQGFQWSIAPGGERDRGQDVPIAYPETLRADEGK